MASLIVPYFHSAAILAQPPRATTLPSVAPWREILAVEPDIAVLNDRSLLLTKANYCVTRACSDRELFTLRAAKSFALAILSDRLGLRLLRTVADTVRRQWPRTRILILGQVANGLEDHLYDEQMDRSPEPQQVLADLERLYEGMWNQRSNTLDWSAAKASRHFVRPQLTESDPTKTMDPEATEASNLRDIPSDMRPSKARLQ
jgi:hypothetical protein